MSLATLWRAKAVAKVRPKKPLKKRKVKTRWTDLCRCGHPFINHCKPTPDGFVTDPCPCGCTEFVKAKRNTRRSRR